MLEFAHDRQAIHCYIGRRISSAQTGAGEEVRQNRSDAGLSSGGCRSEAGLAGSNILFSSAFRKVATTTIANLILAERAATWP